MMDISLGGNIVLTGFRDLSRQELVIVKKIVGSYARKLSDNLSDFQELKVTLKSVHKTENSEKYELHTSVRFGRSHFEAGIVERNLFVGLDSCIGKVAEHAMREEEKLKA
jgi:hypothetical protein